MLNVNLSASRALQRKRHWILLLVAAALLLMSSSCGGQPTDLPTQIVAQPSYTSSVLPPSATASLANTATLENTATSDYTATPEETATAFVPGACESGTTRLDIDTAGIGHVSSGTYPDACTVYCLSVPTGSNLEIGIRGFSVDLDMYVDKDLSVLAFSDHGRWESNDFGTGDEAVFISNPEGEYYVQVCSYEGLASDFTIYNEFTP